jgi:hypothetical protein
MRIVPHSAAVILIPLLSAFGGCERPVKMEPDRPPEVEMLMPVGDVDDLAHDKEYDRLIRMFAPGSEPSQKALAHYSDFRYEGKNPRQFGETATAMVAIKDAKTGQDRGEFKWTMTRIKGAWKLTDAPLPAN